MRIYLTGVVDPEAKRICAELGVRNYLLSFAFGKRAFDQNSDILQNPECNVIVDSGAFSAWNSGKKIDINEYAEFALRLREQARCELVFVNFDVIPGSKGTRPTELDREISAERSFKNWEYLKEQGVPTMNVFHQHERFYWLDEFQKHSNYIGISPANDVSVMKRGSWLNEVFQWVGPSVRTHGFAVTAGPLLKAFPFFSVDSTTWMGGVKYLNIVSMNWSKFGIGQIPKRKFRENLPKIAPDLVAFTESAGYRFRVGVREFLKLERFITDLWSARGVDWSDPLAAESTPDPIALGLCRRARFSNQILSCKGVPIELVRFLKDLKGARLAVWLAHLMDSDDQGVTNLSVKWISRLTGLNYDTITAQRTWLIKNGWLAPQPEALNHGRFGPRRFQVTLPFKPGALPPPPYR